MPVELRHQLSVRKKRRQMSKKYHESYVMSGIEETNDNLGHCTRDAIKIKLVYSPELGRTGGGGDGCHIARTHHTEQANG